MPINAYVPIHVPPMPTTRDAMRFHALRWWSDPLSAIPLSAYREPVTARRAFARSNISATSRDPDILAEVLIERAGDFPKSPIDQQIMRPAVGDSLLVAEGETWRWKRRLASAFLHLRGVSPDSAPDIAAPFKALAEEWRDGRGRQHRCGAGHDRCDAGRDRQAAVLGQGRD